MAKIKVGPILSAAAPKKKVSKGKKKNSDQGLIINGFSGAGH